MPRRLEVGESPTEGQDAHWSAFMAEGWCVSGQVSVVRQDGLRLGCPQLRSKMPIVCQDGSMLGCPQSKFPWCAKVDKVPVVRQRSGSPG